MKSNKSINKSDIIIIIIILYALKMLKVNLFKQTEYATEHSVTVYQFIIG